MSETTIYDLQRSESRQLSVLAITSHRPGEIRESVEAMAAHTAVVTIEPSSARFGQISETYRDTRDAIWQHDPDVILLDCFETMGTVVTLLARRHDIPLVARLVGDTWTGFGSTRVRDANSFEEVMRAGVHRACLGMDEFVFDRADGFVTVSRELQGIAADRTGCPPERIGVVPVPLTTDTLEKGSPAAGRRALGIEEETVVLTVTNLKFEEKFEGVETTLSELAPLLRNDSEVAYVVAGGGRYESELRESLERRFEEPVRDQVYLPGYVDEVSDLYAAADLFVYVSYRDGYPNAVLEAQTAQLPVVANAAHGMRDQITHGETGLLFETGSDGALRDKVESLLADHQLRRDLGTAARQRVMRENSPAQVSAQLAETLQRILSHVKG
jgi:glycosyltransferase involved in cell wall biosynthesis